MFFERGFGRHYILILSIILIGVVTSVVAFVASRNREYQKVRLSFEDVAEHRYETLRVDIGRDLGILESLQALYATNDHVTRSQFGDFGRYSLSRHRSIQALEWIPRVSAEQRGSYERDARGQGFQAFQITEKDDRGKMTRASNREEFFPVYYVEPYRGNEAALGFDLGSNAARRAALEQARDTGGMAASQRIKLVQEKGDQYGFLVFAPVYRRGAPLDTVEGRRQNLKGFVLGVFRIGDMLEKALNRGSPEGVPFSVYDTAAPKDEQFLYHHSSHRFSNEPATGAGKEPGAAASLHLDKRMDIGGREWLIVFIADPDYVARNRTSQPWAVLVVGLLFTGLVVTYLLTYMRHVRALSVINSHLRDEAVERRRAVEAVKKSEATLKSVLSASPVGIALCRNDRVVEWINDHMATMTGYALDDVRGKVPAFLYGSEDEFRRVEDALYNSIRSGRVGTAEGKWVRKDGACRDVQVSGAPVDSQDPAAGIVFTAIDITERKRAEEALRESEKRLRRFYESGLIGVIYWNMDGAIIDANDKFLEIVGYTREELAADQIDWLHMTPEEYRHLDERSVEELKAVGVNKVPFEKEYVRKDGTRVPIIIAGAMLDEARFNGVAIVLDITEHKRAEGALRESEERYRIAIENSNDGIVLARKDKLIFVNRRFLEISGYDSEEEVMRLDSSVLVHPADRERVSMLAEMRMRGEPVPSRYEFRGVTKDGTERDMEANVASFLYRGDRVSLVHFRDITEHKRAEELLRESENKFKDLSEKAIVGVFLAQDGVFKYVNSRFAEIHGYEVGELIDRKGFQDMVVPEDLRGLQENLERLLSGEADLLRAQEFRLRTKQGETKNVEIHGTHTMYRGKRAIIGTLLDVTERKTAEEALRWKTAFLEALLEVSPDGILVTDGKEKNILQNRRTAELWKIPPEIADHMDDGAWGRHVLGMVKGPDKFNQQVLYLRSHPNESIRGEIELLDGTVLDRYSSPVVGKDGTYYGRIFGYHDITERRQAEELLKRIVTNSPMGIFIFQRGKTQLVNAQFQKFTGYDEDEAIGMNFLDIIHPDDRAKVVDLGRKMLRAELTTPYEYRITTKSGEIRTLMETVTPIHYRGEKAALGNVMDITERKALESQLAQSQKLEAIGQLAAGIAHEINTPIQYVGDNINFLQDAFRDTFALLEEQNNLVGAAKARSLDDNIIALVEQRAEAVDLPYLTAEIPRAIEQSLEGIGRVTKIVRAMKEFSHPGTKEKTFVDINKAIENTITVSRNEWKYTSDMVTDFDPSLPLVPCLPGEFNQVILNIIVNAAQAMGEIHDGSDRKGVIKIATRLTGNAAEIRISDTGLGVPEAIRSRIFDPFFTTKEVGKGTGQGLAIARSVIVDKHNGTIDCETKVGKGTTFIICLPIDEKQNGD